MSASDAKAAVSNLNTILLAIALAVLSWIGYTTQQTSVAVAVIAERSAVQDREVLALRGRVAQIELRLAEFRPNATP